MAAAPAAFDMAALDVVVAGDVRDAATRIRTRMQRTASDIVEIGRDLILVKKALPHGAFLPWIEAEFGMSDQTARKFMHVAENLADKFKHDLDLPPTVLYALAAPSTPPEVRDNVVKMVERGEKVSPQTVKDLKEKLKLAEAAAKSERETRAAVESRSREVMQERDNARTEAMYLRSELHQVQSREKEPAAAPAPQEILPPVNPTLVAILALYRASDNETQRAVRREIGV